MNVAHSRPFTGSCGARQARGRPGNRALKRRNLHLARQAQAEAVAELEDAEPAKLQPVEKVISVKLVFEDDGKPSVRYLVKWKEGEDMTWEPTDNLSEDLVRDFEEGFWAAVKTADLSVLEPALQYGGATAANLVDSESRGPLHFAAALNQVDLVDKLLSAGAFANAVDKEGYTPLHMAAGYLHNAVCTSLLAAGADPARKDRQGRDIPGLLDSLREKMTSAAAIQNRMRLEEVQKALTYFTYEDVAPAAILNHRKVGGKMQYLVAWRDDTEDSWVAEDMVSEEVVHDYEAGLEYADAVGLKDVRKAGTAKEYLVEWSDGSEDTWESEDNITRALVAAFEKSRKQNGAAEAPAKEEQLQPAAA